MRRVAATALGRARVAATRRGVGHREEGRKLPREMVAAMTADGDASTFYESMRSRMETAAAADATEPSSSDPDHAGEAYAGLGLVEDCATEAGEASRPPDDADAWPPADDSDDPDFRGEGWRSGVSDECRRVGSRRLGRVGAGRVDAASDADRRERVASTPRPTLAVVNGSRRRRVGRVRTGCVDAASGSEGVGAGRVDA